MSLLNPRNERLEHLINLVKSRESLFCLCRLFSARYRWGSIAEIQLNSSSETCRIVFFGAPKLKVKMHKSQTGPDMGSPLDEADFGAESISAQGGLRLAREVSIGS